jgi:hypothetical protein
MPNIENGIESEITVEQFSGLVEYLSQTGRKDLEGIISKEIDKDFVNDTKLQRGEVAKQTLGMMRNLFNELKQHVIDKGVPEVEISDDNLTGYVKMMEEDSVLFARKVSRELTRGAHPGEIADRLAKELGGDDSDEDDDVKKPH